MKKVFLFLLFVAVSATVANAQHTQEYYELKAQTDQIEIGWTLEKPIQFEANELAVGESEVISIWGIKCDELPNFQKPLITYQDFENYKIPASTSNVSIGHETTLAGINLLASVEEIILSEIPNLTPEEAYDFIMEVMPEEFEHRYVVAEIFRYFKDNTEHSPSDHYLIFVQTPNGTTSEFKAFEVWPGMFNDSEIEDIEIFKEELATLAIAKANHVEFTFTVYPNPATDVIRFKGITNIVDVAITDMSGRTVKRINQQLVREVSVNDLSAGIYMVTVSDGNYTNTQRLVIE